jgi:hypothetical protein
MAVHYRLKKKKKQPSAYLLNDSAPEIPLGESLGQSR